MFRGLRHATAAGLLVAAILLPHSTQAELPGTEFTYQGFLNHLGAPANGLYDFEFRLFDTSTGSPITDTSTHSDIQVTDGIFIIPDVDFGEDFDIALTDAEVEIKARQSGTIPWQTLAPRQPFTAAPLAGHIVGIGLDSHSRGTRMCAYDGDGVSARWGTSPNGAGAFQGWAKPPGGYNSLTALLDADRDADPYNSDAEGLLRLKSTGATSEGGRIQVQDRNGTTTIELVGGLDGDDAVDLPNEAVSAQEILDEPGVGSDTEGAQAADLNPGNTGPTTLAGRQIDCPGYGFVLVIGTCQLTAEHDEGQVTRFEFGVTNQTGFPANQDVAIRIPSNVLDGDWSYAVTVHGLFRVTEPGSYQYSFLGRQYSGACCGEVWDVQLTVIYFPTAYGTVHGTAVATGGRDKDPMDSVSTSVHGETSRSAAYTTDADRRDLELEMIRRELAELRALINERER